MKKLLIIALVLLLCFVAYSYLNYKNYFKNTSLGYNIKNTQGWFKLQQAPNMKVSLGTKNSQNDVVSYFGLGVIPHLESSDYSSLKLEMSDMCKDIWKDQNQTFIGIEETVVSGQPSIVCVAEGTPPNVSSLYTFRLYTVFNKSGKKYDYIISLSYPKTNTEEQRKVDTLIKGVEIL